MSTIKKVYLAAPSSDLQRVVAAATTISAAGYLLTEYWWARIIEAHRRGWAHDSEVPEDYMVESAQRNRDGIREADAVIALSRSEGGFSSGVAGEIGYALSELDNERVERDKKRIILVGNCKGFVWSWLVPATHRVGTVREAVKLLSAR